MKEFKAESKRLLDLMINSIYTNKEIFLRELISNCSDALDKQHFASLTDSKAAKDFEITIEIDKANRTLAIIDNGCGMTESELEENLSTIAKSGTYEFKKEHKDEGTLIGQFGVGFYSAFMVADSITVISKAYKAEKAYKWTSSGADGYEIGEGARVETGTTIILHLKENDEDCRYDDFLNEYRIKELVKKYSDYIRYPIKMMTTTHTKKQDSEEYEETSKLETLNSMIPIWKTAKGKTKQEEYNEFYKNTYHDYYDPLKVISAKLEGTISYNTLLFIPSKMNPMYRSKEYKRGLTLYSDGVMIMEHCEGIIPEYLGFIKGLVDTSDLSLNISREILQHTRQLKTIEASLEKKILSEFKKMIKSEKERDTYEKIFEVFGEAIKFGAYDDYGAKKDLLKDILIFKSSNSEKMTTFSEYVERMKDNQDTIFYVCGEEVEQMKKLPQCENVAGEGNEILYLTDRIDEFIMKVIGEYNGKKIKSVSDNDAVKETDEQKKEAKEKQEESKDLLEFMKGALKGRATDVRITLKLKNHAVVISTEGQVSLEMEKVFAQMQDGAPPIKASKVLEINPQHAVFEKLKELFISDKEKLKDYSVLLFDTALMQEGMEIEDKTGFAALIQKLL